MSDLIKAAKDLIRADQLSLPKIFKQLIGKAVTPYNLNKVRDEALDYVIGEKIKYGITPERPLYDVTGYGNYLGGEVIFDIDMILGNTRINYIEFYLNSEHEINAVFQDEDGSLHCVYMNVNEYNGKNSGPYWFVWAYNTYILHEPVEFYRIMNEF